MAHCTAARAGPTTAPTGAHIPWPRPPRSERPRIVEWGDEYASLGTPEAGRPRFLFLPFGARLRPGVAPLRSRPAPRADLDIPKHLRQAPPDVVNSLRKDAAAKLARTLTALVEAASVPRAARKHGGLRDLATEPPGPHRLRAQTAHAIFLVTTTRFYPDSMLHTVCESTPLRTLLFGNDLDRVSARAKASEVHKLGLFSKDAVVATLRRAFNRELAPHCVAATAHVGALGIPVRARRPAVPSRRPSRPHPPPSSSSSSSPRRATWPASTGSTTACAACCSRNTCTAPGPPPSRASAPSSACSACWTAPRASPPAGAPSTVRPHAALSLSLAVAAI